MKTFYYIVESIEGDYANLRRTDIESDELKLVAMALLPAGIVARSFKPGVSNRIIISIYSSGAAFFLGIIVKHTIAAIT